MKKLNEFITTLRDALLLKLLSGELRVKEAWYEPWLEKVRAHCKAIEARYK